MQKKQKNILKQLKELDKIQNDKIDYSDSDDLSKLDFKNFDFFENKKQQITLRIDNDILDFFKKMGKGYQTRINQVLREYKKQKHHI